MQKIADQIIENGKIATLAPGDSMAEAIAITEDKILAVGSTSEVDALADKNTTRIDARGSKSLQAKRQRANGLSPCQLASRRSTSVSPRT